MSIVNRDMCVVCSRIVKNCHKNICCKNCNGFVHKKCTKLKQKYLKCLNPKEWVCHICSNNEQTSSNSDLENAVNDLNESPQFNVTDVNLAKYDNMIFNPLRFDCNPTSKAYNDITNSINETTHKCSYMTPTQFHADPKASSGKFNLLNVNIRSLSKNFDKLKECIKALNCDFNVIGISETHLKEKPNDYYNIPGFTIEYTNRTDREKGGVCMFISDQVKYKLRTDLSQANSSFESCFIEIENRNKNVVVGVVYRSHTSINDFITDIEPIYKKLNSEKKQFYVMGDFNIDLLKAESQRPIHDYLELIYSLSLLPTIYKPTRITETTATLIDNILTNNDEIVQSTIVVSDITDHMPTILSTNLDLVTSNVNDNAEKVFYKRNYCNANIEKLKQRLSEVKWHESLDNINVNADYDKFIATFNSLYDECIPLKNVKSIEKKIQCHHG